MINKIQCYQNNPVSFGNQNARYSTYEEYAAHAQSRRIPPRVADYNPKVSILERAVNGIANMARGSKSRKFRSNYEWVMFSHNTVEEYRANRRSINAARKDAVEAQRIVARDFVTMENLLERNVGGRFLDLHPEPCEIPNRDDPSTSDITWYEKVDKRSELNDYYNKITVPTYHCQGCITGYDGVIRSAAKSYDFINKLYLKNSREIHENNKTYFKFSSAHALKPQSFKREDYASNNFDWNDLGKIIKKPFKVESGKFCLDTNTLEADSITVFEHDSAKNIKSSKTYINPVVQYYVDESGERRCSITADYAYEIPERRSSYGNKTKYYKNVSEIHSNPRDYVIEAEHAIIMDDDTRLSKCYGNYCYNSKTKQTLHDYMQDLNINDIKTAFQHSV